MIGTIVSVETRESRVSGHTFLKVTFLDDYEEKHILNVSIEAEQYFMRFCRMTNWDWTEFMQKLVGKLISVNSSREHFQGIAFTRWSLGGTMGD